MRLKITEQALADSQTHGEFIYSKLIKGKQINFFVFGKGSSFTINASDPENKRIGYINLKTVESLQEPTYAVKYVTVEPEYRKSGSDTESVAKNLYDLGKAKAKEFGGQFFASDTRLSADSSRNWLKMRKANPEAVGVVDDPKGKVGKDPQDPLEKGRKQRYRIRLEVKTRKK